MALFLYVFGIVIFHLCPSITAQATAVVSINSDPGYNLQRLCVKECLWGSPNGGDLSVILGCSSPWVNACYCRADLASSASSFLTKCATSLCPGGASATVDIAGATSLYNEYCSQAVGVAVSVPNTAVVTTPLNPTGTATVTTIDNGNGPTVTTVDITTATSTSETTSVSSNGPATGIMTTLFSQRSTKTVTEHSTTTIPPETTGAGLSGSGQDPGGANTSNKIALGVGIGIGIPTLLVSIWMCCVATARHSG